MIRGNLVFGFFLIVSQALFAQFTDCMNYNDAMEDPAHAICVSLDCMNDDCNSFFSSIDEFTNLNSLEVINCDRDYFPRDVSNLKQLNNISIVESPGLNLTNIFRKFSAMPALTSLTLDNNGLKVLPKTIIMLQRLEKLSVRNNESLNIEHTIVLLSHMPSLKNLSLPVNQISDLPENINLLKNLEVLDLSDNQLTDLPKSIGEMDSLKVLNIEKNIFINPAKTLEKLKGLNIRYLSYDPVITGKDKEKLQKIFPKAAIVEVYDTIAAEDDFNDKADTSIAAMVGADEDSSELRTIMVTGEKFQALSDAYLHYPVIFDQANFKNTFDTLLFDERYLDTSYSNVWKIQPWRTYNNIALYLYKSGEKGEIWFDFHTENKKGIHITQYVAKNNPELMVFLGYKWVYQGNLTRRQFIRKYINTPTGQRFWHDARIYYNDVNKNFVIELKDQEGFTQIGAYVRARSIITSLEKAQESYEGFFERYTRSLDARRNRFQKRLFKDKASYDVTMQRSIAIAWEGFKRIYMNSEERHMSMKKWLEYYDAVLADEKRALYNAAPTVTLIERNFALDGYVNATSLPVVTDTSVMKGIYGMFRDDKKNMVAVVKVIALNLSNKTYRVYEGSLGLKSIKLYFRVPSSYALIAELRNGDIGVLKPGEFDKITLRNNVENIFNIERISYRISTIGQIKEMIGVF